MKKNVHAMSRSVRAFVQDEAGSQVVEYALIIAVMSVGLVAALGGDATALPASFSALVDRVKVCFSPAACI